MSLLPLPVDHTHKPRCMGCTVRDQAYRDLLLITYVGIGAALGLGLWAGYVIAPAVLGACP